MANSNMGVSDAEFISAAQTIQYYGNYLIEKINQYIAAVQIISTEAIQDNLIDSKLNELCNQVESLRKPLTELTADVAEKCQTFIDAIDQADNFLY